MSTPIITPDIISRLRAAQQGAQDAPPPIVPLPSMGMSAVPNVVPPSPAAAAPNQTLTDLSRLNQLRASGTGVSHIQNPVLHALAAVGDVIGSVAAPNIAQYIKGTTANHQRDLGMTQQAVQQDQANDTQQAQVANLNLQPVLKEQAAALAQEKQNNVESHEQDQLGQQKALAQQKYTQNLRDHGFAPDEADPTGAGIRPLKYDEMSQTQQAVHDLKTAQEEQSNAQTALKKAQNDPTSAAYQLAKQRVDVARQNAATASGKLGLSTQEFAFNQDKFYNPQPTAAERGKGDLAQSALERVQEMRGVLTKHPEWFGPGAGRYSNVQAAIGSQDPDMQKYLSAAQYLSDHSAGVFGGRGKYITEQLHGLTDPHSNPAALGSALDEAEAAARGFVKVGTVHGKGGGSPVGGQASPAATHVFNPATGQIEEVK